MNCPKCNGKVSKENKQCPFCGMDLSIYKKVDHLSNAYYNDGLQKAKIRDLSGALESLKKSLELNKKNTQARNLIGLVYFEMGDTVEAISAWVISKHFQAEDNDADAYVKSVQKNASKLDALNQAVKKYNNGLLEAKAVNVDLAVIQLKKAISLNPHYVRALLLLALLHMKLKEREKAKKLLHRVLRIDIANTTALTYLRELEVPQSINVEHRERTESSKEKVIERNPNVSFMPISTYREEKPNVRAWINLVVGTIFGIACSYFLFVPAAKQSVRQEYKTISTDYDTKLSTYTAQITSLENEKTKLNETAEQLQKQLDSIEIPEYDEKMYDYLFEASNLYIEQLGKNASEQDFKAVAKSLSKVKEKALENKAAAKAYKQLKEQVYGPVSLQLYEEGHNQYLAGKYDDALKTLLESYDYDSQNENTIYFIGRTYHRLGDTDQAKKYYNKIIKHFSDTSRYGEARQRLAEIGD